MKDVFPRIRMDAKPAGLKFKAPASAFARFDKTVRSAAKADGEIEIIGEIGESFWSEQFTTAKMVKDQLKAIGKAPVLITINSPGGDAFEGIAIYNLLREHPGKVTVNVLGLAASAASIIAMAGDTIKMGDSAFLMIHSSHGIMVGNQEDMREFAQLLDSIDRAVASLYAARTGKPEPEVLDLMKKETWMSGKDAVAAGFADIAEGKKAARAAITPSISASMPMALLAASGNGQRPVVRLSATLPGASGSPHRGTSMKTIAEQLAALEAKRMASMERRQAIQSKAIEDGRTKTEAEKQEFDTLSTEISTIDAELVDLKLMEKQVLANATPVPANAGAAPAAASAARGGVASDIVVVGPKLEKGQKFARYAMAMFQAEGNHNIALNIVRANRRWMDTSPELEKVLMTAVATGDTTTAGWASELVYAQNLANEFIEYLRPKTIIGRLPNLRMVPFNVRMGSQTGGGTGYWVGQAKPIPVSKATTSSLSLGITKNAGIMTLDDELLRSSSPSAEMLVRDDLAKSCQQSIDDSFINPNYAGTANVQPASILYGVAPITPTNVTAAALATDIASLFAAAIAANLDPSTGVFLMSPTTALNLSLMLTANGIPQYPNITINGGNLLGLPVIVSNSAKIAGSPQYGEMIVLILQEEILLADDGQVVIEVSKEAALELKDNPTNSGAGGETATSMVSMFQTHSAAIKAVRYINWIKRRSTAAAFIQAANYHQT